MRVFLCSFNNFFLAIPMDCVSSLSLLTQDSLQSDRKQVSIPELFDLPEETIKYSIVLKNAVNNDHNAVLLTTEVECEYEIPDEVIFPVPNILSFSKLYAYLSGIYFNEEKIILLLNPNKLTDITQKDHAS